MSSTIAPLQKALSAERNLPIAENATGSPTPPVARPGRARVLVLFLLWPALIFSTSCTVIRPDEFFRLVASLSGASRESMERFAVFWGISWFTIVKGWHFTEFAILTVLATWALQRIFGQSTSRSIILAMFLCIAFAASDEWHQSFVPDRFGTVQDVLIDSLGVCTAGAILLTRWKQKKIQSQALES